MPKGISNELGSVYSSGKEFQGGVAILGDGGHYAGADGHEVAALGRFGRGFVMRREHLVGGGASRVGVELHEHLADGFPAKSLADGRDLACGFGGAALAGESDFGANLGERFSRRLVHVGMIMPCDMLRSKRIEVGWGHLFCGYPASGGQSPRCYPETSYGSKPIARAPRRSARGSSRY